MENGQKRNPVCNVHENGTGQLSTSELWSRLFKAPSLGQYFDHSGSQQEMPEFSDYISQMARERNEKPETIIKRGGIERSYGHRLFSGARNPSRDTVLQFAFGFEFDSDEAQKLLKIARATPLHPRVKRDAVIAYCLHRHIGFMDTQQLLYENGLPPLGGKLNGK